VTKILDGDSIIHKTKKTRNQSRAAAPPRGCDRMATPLGTLGLGLVICLFMLCIIGFYFLFFYMNDTLFKSFNMHLYILSYMI